MKFKKYYLYLSYLVVLCLYLSACSGIQLSSGEAQNRRVTTYENGMVVEEVVKVKAPKGASEPATIEMGDVVITTGANRPPSQALTYLKQLPLIGAGLIVLGIILILLKMKFGLIPAEVGFGLLGSGILLTLLPSLAEQYLGYLLVFLGGLLVLGLTIWRLNKVNHQVKKIESQVVDPVHNPSANLQSNSSGIEP